MGDAKILPERLEKLETLSLGSGKHASFEEGHCAMEVVSWMAGEPFSDHPACACPVVSAALRSWNDAMPDDEHRNSFIRPLLPRLVGSRSGSDDVLMRRMWMVQDWHVSVRAPAFLRLAGLEKEALALESCAEITDLSSLEASGEAASAAESAARSAASAAEEKLKPTVDALHLSFVKVVERMLAVEV